MGGKNQHLDWTAKSIFSTGSERVPFLNKEKKRGNEQSTDDPTSDLELGDAVPAANVGFCRVFSLAKPDAGKLAIGTIALLSASTASLLIPKYGGMIIDIVSRDLTSPEQQSQALSDVRSTILEIFLIVLVGCPFLRDGIPILLVSVSSTVSGFTALDFCVPTSIGRFMLGLGLFRDLCAQQSGRGYLLLLVN
ncbi:ABC transporter B family member 27-like protein, partial [Drosera capensis]